jgi:hypothetical protein
MTDSVVLFDLFHNMHAWWRPTVINDEVLSKLEFGFSNSLTDEEACLYADICPKTLYRYIEDNPEFWQRKEILKRQPNIKAKFNWVNKIWSDDYTASKEWLERKAKSEFSVKSEVDTKQTIVDITDDLTPEQKHLIASRHLNG